MDLKDNEDSDDSVRSGYSQTSDDEESTSISLNLLDVEENKTNSKSHKKKKKHHHQIAKSHDVEAFAKELMNVQKTTNKREYDTKRGRNKDRANWVPHGRSISLSGMYSLTRLTLSHLVSLCQRIKKHFLTLIMSQEQHCFIRAIQRRKKVANLKVIRKAFTHRMCNQKAANHHVERMRLSSLPETMAQKRVKNLK